MRILSFAFLLLFWVSCLALAQQPSPTPSPMQNQGMSQMSGSRGMQGMNQMSEAMAQMADMCRLMMEKEQAMMPYKMGGLALLGALFAIALTLLIVLEIQWIRYWSLRLKRADT